MALLTVQEVADRVGVNTDTVRRWIRQRRLAATMPGGTRTGYRVEENDLKQFLDTNKTQAAA